MSTRELVRMAERLRPTLREADSPDDGLGILEGFFTVFDSETIIDSWWEGKFREKIARGAFKKTFAEDAKRERRAIKVAFNHGMDPQVGDKTLGPILVLREDDTGPWYEVRLHDTSYNRDLLPGIRDQLYGASFRFEVVKDKWDQPPKDSAELPLRTIQEVRLYEFGPVTYPAYEAATAGIRSRDQYALWRSLDEEGRRELIRLIQQAHPGEGTPPGAAQAGIDEPGEPHSAVSPRAALDQRARRINALLKEFR